MPALNLKVARRPHRRFPERPRYGTDVKVNALDHLLVAKIWGHRFDNRALFPYTAPIESVLQQNGKPHKEQLIQQECLRIPQVVQRLPNT
jgi:hypothetical protein